MLLLLLACLPDLNPPCDGEALEAFQDADADGWGAGEGRWTCALEPGESERGGDCDDDDPAVHPEATEWCNDLDDDCDGAVDDDAEDGLDGWPDADEDGFGAEGPGERVCSLPVGWADRGKDCDDQDPNVNPGVPEVCDGEDQDCNGHVDDGAVDARVWFLDDDQDGYGDAESGYSCEPPPHYTAEAGDCDDQDPTVHPGATESCDGVDQDCDGTIDDGDVCPCTTLTWDGGTYLFCPQLSWEAGRDSCLDLGYRLASVHDEDENRWLADRVDEFARGAWWIGLNDRDVEGQWIWDDGSSFTWDAWAVTEPWNLLGSEDCARLSDWEVWVARSCDEERPYICEAR